LPLPLPPSSDTTLNDVRQSEMVVNGRAVQLDALGPVVLNTDGTVSRITNWQEMTEDEKLRTLRVLVARNK
ncbi:hypothetical protein K488DRAFT_30158, partial [Vararia minispora EC-137]